MKFWNGLLSQIVVQRTCIALKLAIVILWKGQYDKTGNSCSTSHVGNMWNRVLVIPILVYRDCFLLCASSNPMLQGLCWFICKGQEGILFLDSGCYFALGCWPPLGLKIFTTAC